MAGLTDQELANYTNRRLMFGEMAAMQWLVNKYGQPSGWRLEFSLNCSSAMG